jgi:hypothetical protein
LARKIPWKLEKRALEAKTSKKQGNYKENI